MPLHQFSAAHSPARTTIVITCSSSEYSKCVALEGTCYASFGALKSSHLPWFAALLTVVLSPSHALAAPISYEFRGIIAGTSGIKDYAFPEISIGKSFCGVLIFDSEVTESTRLCVSTAGYDFASNEFATYWNHSAVNDELQFVDYMPAIITPLPLPCLGDDLVLRLLDPTASSLTPDGVLGVDLTKFSSKEIAFDGYVWGPAESTLFSWWGSINNFQPVPDGSVTYILGISLCALVSLRNLSSRNTPSGRQRSLAVDR